ENTAVGVKSLRLNSVGFQNTAVGHQALYANTTGNYNTAIGMKPHQVCSITFSQPDQRLHIGLDGICINAQL
ncbi:MAG: hypothetical protein ABIQ02_02890, partial [Saprospiraceae bacterium]